MIILSGNPLSTQHIYQYTCRGKFGTLYMTKKGKDTLERYQLEAKTQWKRDPIKGPVSVNVTLYFGDKRGRDIDNYGKLLYDSLEGIVYLDDKQIQKATTTKSYCKSDPRIEIEVYEIEESI